MHELTKQALADGLTSFHCECCGKKLNPKTMTWLERNMDTGEYVKLGEALWSDTEESQGCFEFGQACARRILKAQKGAK